jgi:hypothetical protein
METELARLSEIPATINPRSRVHADRGLGILAKRASSDTWDGSRSYTANSRKVVLCKPKL